MSFILESELSIFHARINAVLNSILPPSEEEPRDLHQAMRYAVLGDGKRLRPLLVYATGQMLGTPLDMLDAPASAVELIHAYSLVHDDLPAMDNDDLRRGRPTCHIQFGEATAILVGDALQALAFEVLAESLPSHINSLTQGKMISVLSRACGSRGMVGGQAFDLEAVGQTLDLDALERMHVYKTGALIRASVRLGALAGNCDNSVTLAALDTYAHSLGLAFQIRDDILDVEGETTVLGKQQGADQRLNKPTYPALLSIPRAYEHLAVMKERALDALTAFGESAGVLRTLAKFAADRHK